MKAFRLKNGNLMVPRRAEAEGVVGDAMVEVGPGDPDYESWTRWYARRGEEPEPWPEDEPDAST